MSKYLLFSIIGLFSLSIVPLEIINGPIEDVLSFDVNSSKYGPFKIGDKDKTIFIYYKCNQDLYINEYFGVGFNKNNYTTNILNSAKTIKKDNETYAKFTLPISTYLTSSGLYCCFRIIDTNSYLDLYKKEFVIYPSSFNNINIDEYRLINYASKNIAFQFVNGDIVPYFETFNFINMKNYIDVDNYHELLINNFSFYSSNSNLTYSSIELTFNDKKNLFPYLRKSDDELIHLPISLINNNNNYHFIFKNGFYYDKTNLYISNTVLFDLSFTKTNHFFFPINKLSLANGYIFTLKCLELGDDKISFSYDMVYDVNKNRFGSCSNSDFCIHGDIGK